MDMNVYLVEWFAHERLRELRMAVGREQLAESLRPRPSLRAALGSALINLGHRLQGERAAAQATGATAAV